MKWSDFTTRFDGKHDPKSSLVSDRNCPDMRWHPAARVAVFVALSSLAWGVVILIASLVTGA
jgi:hypothetical protein